MFLKTYLNHPIVKKYIKTVGSGQPLFKQGQVGNTMYLIVDGVIQLHDDSNENSNLIGTYGPGQFFGEKALLSQNPYQRFYSAKALTDSHYLEFGLSDVRDLQTAIPDFMLRVFQSAATRLDRAYLLIRILKASQPIEKLVHGILYFYRCPGLTPTAGSLIPIRSQDLAALVQLDVKKVSAGLEHLCLKGVLTKSPTNDYFLKDEQELIHAIPDLQNHLAA